MEDFSISPEALAATVGIQHAAHATPDAPAALAAAEVDEAGAVFDEDDIIAPRTLPGRHSYQYIPWGADDRLPYDILHMVGIDEVMSQNKLFNVLTNYGQGLQLVERATGEPTDDAEVREWLLRNAPHQFQLEQTTDMKHFYFAIAVITLSRDGRRITHLRHREACYCRFQKADGHGRIAHVFYGNFRHGGATEDNVEVLPLLDFYDPLGDLRRCMGLEAYPDGTRRQRPMAYKYAILTRFPTPGLQYYPIPYWASIFRGDWYDIKRMIGKGKKALMRNHAVVKYHVELHREYFQRILMNERITDHEKQRERIRQEKQRITDFITGAENSGKVWFSNFMTTPDGREQHDVVITPVNTGKAGGEWSEDIQEAANMTCYGDNIHPNLVGATPGKSQSNNSGSDKRELFTMKQALERAWHDIQMTPWHLVLHYNGWADRLRPEIPLLMLTTLDEHTDAKTIEN